MNGQMFAFETFAKRFADWDYIDGIIATAHDR